MKLFTILMLLSTSLHAEVIKLNKDNIQDVQINYEVNDSECEHLPRNRKLNRNINIVTEVSNYFYTEKCVSETIRSGPLSTNRSLVTELFDVMEEDDIVGCVLESLTYPDGSTKDLYGSRKKYDVLLLITSATTVIEYSKRSHQSKCE